MRIALLAGTHSGCGKTTITLALLRYFQNQNQAITAFKAGPDFLDPLWHQAIMGKASYNLDTRMMGEEACRLQLLAQAEHTEIALIEGVMGLFDGASGVGGEGSSVDLARVVHSPVILVVDAAGMSGTIAALVSGFVQFAAQKQVCISGIIANKVGSTYHAELLKNALLEYDLPPLVAWMARNSESLGERHLGLKTPVNASIPDFSAFFHIDAPALLQAFKAITPIQISPITATPGLKGKTIAVAKDEACCFIYPANLDWLRANGADVVFFSPVAGEVVPDGVDAVWLPGGYPELHVQALSVSATWASLNAVANAGKPILAECGGAMLLGKAIVDINGKQWPMAAMFPFLSIMQPRLASLGYRADKSGVRGHEFHYSTRENAMELTPAFDVEQGDNGVRYNNVRASYIHWYFSSETEHVARWFNAD